MNDQQKLYPQLIYRINDKLSEVKKVSKCAKQFVVPSVFNPYERNFHWLMVHNNRWKKLKKKELKAIKKHINKNKKQNNKGKDKPWDIFKEKYPSLKTLKDAFKILEKSANPDEYHHALLMVHQFYPVKSNKYIDGIIYRNLPSTHKIDYATAELQIAEKATYKLYPWVKIDFYNGGNPETRYSCQENNHPWYPKNLPDIKINQIPLIKGKNSYNNHRPRQFKDAKKFPLTPAHIIKDSFYHNYFLPFFVGNIHFKHDEFLKLKPEYFTDYQHLVIIPLYDAYIEGTYYGNLCGTLQIPFKTGLNKFIGKDNKLEKLISNSHLLTREIKEAAIFEVLQQPIDDNTDLLEHFIKYITLAQDWERIMVWKYDDKKNIKLDYCYKHDKDDNNKWDRCKKVDNGTNCKKCKPNFDRLKEWIKDAENKHLPIAENGYKNKKAKRKAVLEYIFNKKLIPELYDKDVDDYKNTRLIFEYPCYTVFPENEKDDHKLGLHYERQQIDILRQMALQLKVKRETVKHGTRAAVAAIMGRNMSHNIGSHVLSYLSEQSIKAINNKLIIESPTIGNAIELDGGYTFGFYKYLQGRSDYIAEISTAQPTWSVNRGLIRDVIEPFVYGDNEKRGELLDNIGKSVYYENDRVRKFLNASKIEINVIKNNKIFNFSYANNVFSLLGNANGGTFDAEFDTVVDIPHGIIGCHAFYSIMENFIRNCIKHNSMKIIECLMQDNKITINITIGEEVDGLISVRLTDNVSEWSDKKERDINKYITGDDRYLVKNDGTLIRGGGWGIKEMKISAAWLRNIAPETIQYDNDPKKFPLLKVCNSNKSLCYEFYMLKPLNVLFVGCNDVADDANLGIYNVSTIEKLEDLIKKGELRHRFIVIHHKHNDWIKENRLKLPERIFLVKNESTNYRTDNGIALIGKDEYKSIIKEPKSIKERLYEKWVKHLFGNTLPNIYIVNENSVKFNGLTNIEQNDILADVNIDKYIVFKHCTPGDNPVSALYYEDFSTAAGGNTLGSKLKVFSDRDTSDTEKRTVLYELYEVSLTEMVIVDERLYAKLHKKIAGIDKKIYDLLFPKKIEIINITKDNNNLMVHILEPCGKVTKKTWVNYLKGKVNQIKFISIHQTIVDNIITTSGLEDIKKNKKIRTVVIHSGRGQVNITPGYKFAELSNIEREIVEKIPDKHLLVSLYMALKLYKEGGN